MFFLFSQEEVVKKYYIVAATNKRAARKKFLDDPTAIQTESVSTADLIDANENREPLEKLRDSCCNRTPLFPRTS